MQKQNIKKDSFSSNDNHLLHMKYTIKFILLIAIAFYSVEAIAQQDPLFTQYMTNPITVNPAVAGVRKIHNVSFSFREQWAGIEGAPQTSALNYSGSFSDGKVGAAGVLIYDQLGPIRQMGIYGSYSYHIRMGETGESRLAFGLMGGANYYTYDLLNLTSDEYDDYVIVDGADQILLPNFGFGMFYYQSNFFVGASIPKLLRNSISSGQEEYASASTEERHFFILSGGIIKLSNDFDLRPSVFGRAVNGAPESLDLNLTGVYKDKIWFGAMYRVKASLGGLVRWQISDNIQIGYSYDMSTNRLASYNAGSHELSLSYDFRPKNMSADLFKSIARFF